MNSELKEPTQWTATPTGGVEMLSSLTRALGLGKPSSAEPETDCSASASLAYVTSRAAPANPTRILVVDDDRDLRELVAFKMRAAGFAVATMPDGPSALALVAQCRPDLVILDIMMPGPSGIEICRQLRETPETAALPIILFTARTNSAFASAGLATGADRHLRKPFSPRVLLEQVEELLGL